jgi:hypothetical protein
MLRQTMTAAEAGLLLKQAFIDSAEDDIRTSGDKPTNARIAIVTGLDRNEVSRLRRGVNRAGNAIDPQNQFNTLNRAAKVITNWPRSTDGTPVRLSLKGKNSFSELVRSYSGGIPAPSMLEELERHGIVECLSGGEISLIRDTFIPQNSIDKLELASKQLERLLVTIGHNIAIQSRENSYLHMELRMDQLNDSLAQSFAHLSKQEGRELLQKWAQKLEQLRQNTGESTTGDKGRCTGVGLYFYDGIFDH